MDGQSYKLETKCSKGAKMGATALENMARFCDEEKIRKTLSDYAAKHAELAGEIDAAIRSEGKEAKNANRIAEWFAVKGIEFKFKGRHDSGEVLRSAISGADKAISSLERYARTYSLADQRACDFVNRTIELERSFKVAAAEARRGD